MIAIVQIDTTAAAGAIILSTHKLQKIFSSPEKAVNINTILVEPSAFGTSQEILLLADSEQEQDDQVDLISRARLIAQMATGILGTTGNFTQMTKAAFKDIFAIRTEHVAGLFHSYTLFPVFNHLKISWSADVDFTMLIDFTVLDRPWNMREEVRNLIGNKRRVEDPNLSSVEGKRSVVKAQIRVPEE